MSGKRARSSSRASGGIKQRASDVHLPCNNVVPKKTPTAHLAVRRRRSYQGGEGGYFAVAGAVFFAAFVSRDL